MSNVKRGLVFAGLLLFVVIIIIVSAVLRNNNEGVVKEYPVITPSQKITIDGPSATVNPDPSLDENDLPVGLEELFTIDPDDGLVTPSLATDTNPAIPFETPNPTDTQNTNTSEVPNQNTNNEQNPNNNPDNTPISPEAPVVESSPSPPTSTSNNNQNENTNPNNNNDSTSITTQSLVKTIPLTKNETNNGLTLEQEQALNNTNNTKNKELLNIVKAKKNNNDTIKRNDAHILPESLQSRLEVPKTLAARDYKRAVNLNNTTHVTGAHNVTIIRAKMAGEQDPPMTNNELLTAHNLAKEHLEQSTNNNATYNPLMIYPEVLTVTNNCDQLLALHDEVMQKIGLSNDLWQIRANRQHFLVVTNARSGCVPGEAFVGYGFGYITSSWPVTYAHELGHQLGMVHSSSVTCSDGRDPIMIASDDASSANVPSDCSIMEYGDTYDLMGVPTSTHPAFASPAQITQLGYAHGQYQLLTPGTHTLASIDNPNNQIKWLEYRDSVTQSTYYIYYRNNSYYDSKYYATTNLFVDSGKPGVFVKKHKWGTSYNKSYLLNFNPPSTDKTIPNSKTIKLANNTVELIANNNTINVRINNQTGSSSSKQSTKINSTTNSSVTSNSGSPSKTSTRIT